MCLFVLLDFSSSLSFISFHSLFPLSLPSPPFLLPLPSSSPWVLLFLGLSLPPPPPTTRPKVVSCRWHLVLPAQSSAAWGLGYTHSGGPHAHKKGFCFQPDGTAGAPPLPFLWLHRPPPRTWTEKEENRAGDPIRLGTLCAGGLGGKTQGALPYPHSTWEGLP